MTVRLHRRWAVLLLTSVLACGRDEILHGLEEAQANQVVVALSDAHIAAVIRREEGTESSWRVEVGRGDTTAAQRLLAERGLPRKVQPGFGEVFGKGSIVPTPAEERALYLHALSGELARTIEAIDGVVEARVHLAVAPQDPLRSEPAPPVRAAVLVKASAGARARVQPLAPGIQSLVAGAVAGLDAGSVSVVIAESLAATRDRDPSSGDRRTWMVALALLLASVAVVVPAVLLSRRHPRIARSIAAVLRRRGAAT